MLADLAEHYNGEYIPLKEISKRQDISKKYLEQIIPMFNNTDVLRAGRGAQGGYMLAKSPEKYTVGDILRITEGSLAVIDCTNDEAAACSRSSVCPTQYVWQGLTDLIASYLDNITLQDIVDKQRKSYANDYFI